MDDLVIQGPRVSAPALALRGVALLGAAGCASIIDRGGLGGIQKEREPQVPWCSGRLTSRNRPSKSELRRDTRPRQDA
jgi:hypothetical protein